MTRPDRILFATLILALCAFAAGAGRADDEGSGAGIPARLAKPGSLATRSASLRSSSAVPDTMYVGYTPGRFNPANNWWSVGAGHGAGFHRPPTQGGMWDLEPTGGSYLHGDSLQGWWPGGWSYTGTGGFTLPDCQRPWWAVDNGNQVNYVLDNGAGGKRTFGVVGVWHRDERPPTSGGRRRRGRRSAAATRRGWDCAGTATCVRRPDHRTTPSTTTPRCSTSASRRPPSGSDKGFPGYGSQWDQMLYRDIDMSSNPSASLMLAFSYRTRMSTGFGNAASTRTGWFDKDPLVVTTSGAVQSGASRQLHQQLATRATQRAPRLVHGVRRRTPDRGSFTTSDSDRSWHRTAAAAGLRPDAAVVLGGDARERAGLYRELDVGGRRRRSCRPRSVTIPNAVLAPMLAASQNRVRLVFRVKTNRGFDDEGTAYTSGGGGAAVVDAVTYAFGTSSSPPGWGDFESASSIDNALTVTHRGVEVDRQAARALVPRPRAGRSASTTTCAASRATTPASAT